MTGLNPPRQAVTARAFCVGLFVTIIVNLTMSYNDFYLKNNLLIGNHFPLASIALLLLIVLAGNTLARKYLKSDGLNGGEMLLIWGMVGVGGGIGSAGLMRYLPSWLVEPAYYTTAANEYSDYILKFLPGWMVVSKDPDNPAVLWFMEGLPQGESIPWGAWIPPLLSWFLLAFFLYTVLFCFTALLFRQWSERERLIFPLVHLPVELVQRPRPGFLLNDFLRNRLVWIGIGVPVLIMGYNGMQAFIPGLPQFLLRWSTWGFFPDRPWNQFNMANAEVFFSVVGLTFLLTTQMAFSLWFFYFLFRLSFVYVAWLGATATGFWGDWNVKVSVFDVTGTVLVLGGFILWTARRALSEWFVRALAGRDDPERELMSPRMTLILLTAGMTGLVAWFLYAGVQWWAVLLCVFLFLAILLVLTRLIAEAGLLFVQTNAVPYDVLTGLFPAGWISGISANVFMLQKAVHMHDLREILMPYLMNGVKACDMVRMHARKVLGVFAVTALVGLLVSSYGVITTYYKYGGVNMDEWANTMSYQWWLGGTAKYLKEPPNYDYVRVGETRVLPANVAHTLTGGALAGVMLFLRARFLWWPLHPFGLLMVGAYAMNRIWFSIFLGWLAKACVMTFGGAHVYRRVLPLFLGLVLGESIVGILFILASLVTGVQAEEILPR